MFLNVLRGCTSLPQLSQIHAQILVNGLPLHTDLLSKLVDLRLIDYARSVFNQITSPSGFSWNVMIKGYTLTGSPLDSLLLYSQMLRDGASPNNFTYPFVFKACSTLSLIKEGEQVHSHVFRLGLRSDLFINNSLIGMYCKCLCVESAHHVLDEMSEIDEVSWNSIISGYVYLGKVDKARELFEEMPIGRNVICWTALINGYGREGNLVEMICLFRQMLLSADDVRPNAATMVCLLSACSGLSDLKLGRWVSVFIDVNAINLNVFLYTALIDMYSKFGDVENARRLFDRTSFKNLESWNAMITGYVQQGLLEEAIHFFYLMQAELVKPDEITMVNVLSACSGLGALKVGREVHLYIGRNRLEPNVILATALVDMYSKCGNVEDACLVFVKTSQKDVALWNAMILGFAYHGNGRDSLAVLAQMERAEASPNEITFIGVLLACNHSGLVEEGQLLFSDMVRKHGLSPKVEHYSCMVDLLGRAGRLDEAMELVHNMVVPPDSIIWGALLSACRIHCNVELADEIGKIIESSQDPDVGFFILLSNIYASVGMWKDVSRMRRLVKEKGVKRRSGYSWIELDGIIHKFVSEDAAHVQSGEIYEANQRLVDHLKIEGYVHLKNIDGM